MSEKTETAISLEALCLLASFTVRETLRTLQSKELISDTDLDSILAKAVEGLHMSTMGLTQTDTDNLVTVLMGRPLAGPSRKLN